MNKYLRTIPIVCMACMLLLAACRDNENSSTVGTYEKEGLSVEKKLENTNNPEKVYIDSSKSVDSSLRKKDAGASPEKNSVNMQSKAAPGKIQPGDTQQQ